MAFARPIATSRLVAGGVLVGGLVVWMAWQRFGGGAPEPPTDRDPPDLYRQATDIYVVPISVADRTLRIGAQWRVVADARDPSLTADGRTMLFASMRDDAERAEIYRYEIASRRVTRLTDSREMEAAPMPMPDGAHFAAARTEADFMTVGYRRIPKVSGTSLWRFALDGSDAQRLFSTTWVVTSQHWLDDSTVAFIVTGNPSTLIVANSRDWRPDTVLRNAGTSLMWSRSRRALLFAQPVDTSLVLTELQWPSRAVRTLMRLPSSRSSFVEIGDLPILATAGSRVLCWHASNERWIDVADLAIAGITGLAPSPDGTWLAVTASRQAHPPESREVFETFVRAPGSAGPRYQVPASCTALGL